MCSAVNVVTSHHTRTLVVRFSKGESLVDSLATLARDHGVGAATLVGHGELQSATIEGYDARAKSYAERRTFSGPLSLTSLSGHVLQGVGDPVVSVHAAFVRETDNGLEALGGHLLDALVVAVDVTLFVHEDLRLTVQVDAATGLASWRGEAPGASAPRAPEVITRVQSASRSVPPPRDPERPVVRETERPVAREPERAPTREVREASHDASREPAREAPRTLVDAPRTLEVMPAKPERADEIADEPEIAVGDVLEHPMWGLCDVLREAEPGTFDIRIQRSGSTRTIKTEIFEVQPRPKRDGRNVWGLKPRGK